MNKILLTGGGGFLGSHILEQLLDSGTWSVVVLDLLDDVRYASEEEGSAYFKERCEAWYTGSFLDTDLLEEVFRKHKFDAILHAASLVDFGNTPFDLLHKVNVVGTENLIDACRKYGVCENFVYISSLDVLTGQYEVDGLDETMPYYTDNLDRLSRGQDDYYAITKTMAEKFVFEQDDFYTVSIRPLGIYGERDRVHLYLALKAQLETNNQFKIGSGTAVFQHVYAGNVAQMAIIAADILCNGSKKEKEKIDGEAFLAYDYTKCVGFLEFMDPYLKAKGYTIPTFFIPGRLLYRLAQFVNFTKNSIGFFIPSIKSMHVTLTPRAVNGVTQSQFFKTDKAERLLGYKPATSPMEARRRSINHFVHHRLDEFPQGNKKNPYYFPYYDEGKKSTYLPWQPGEARKYNNEPHVFQNILMLILLIAFVYFVYLFIALLMNSLFF